jgi:molybdopterin-containing oxidoreductase family iron-sulfur binding subunit
MKNKSRRDFIKRGSALGLLAGATGVATLAGNQEVQNEPAQGPKKPTKKIKVLTAEGKVIEVDEPATDCAIEPCAPAQGEAAREGIPGRSFVMVVDLAKCNNARKCIEGCQKGHDLLPDQEFMSVHLMKDNPDSEPYWFPNNCFHCSNPPCVKVCPVGATFKRQDNIVLVDADLCIGCKFCMVACPYSARIFNWTPKDSYANNDPNYSPETSVPAQLGTVSKCDFCPDRAREGKLPYCATSCPMGAIYFGDKNEDAVTNGIETLRFKKLIEQRMGYRYLEDLGTEPNVFYLPPVDRMFDYESGLEDVSEERRKIYDDIIGENDPKID